MGAGLGPRASKISIEYDGADCHVMARGRRAAASATGAQSSPSLYVAMVELARRLRPKRKQCRSADILVRQAA